MTPAAAPPPELPHSPRRSGPLPLRVMLVVAQAQRREQLRAAIARLIPDARIEIARSGVDALLRSAQSQATDLLVLDLSLDGAAGPALTRHLARIAQSTAVLVFGDDATHRPGAADPTWAWHEIDQALRHWLDERKARGAPPG